MIQQAEPDISAQEMVDMIVRDVFDGGDDPVTNCPYPTVSDSENWARFHCGRLTAVRGRFLVTGWLKPHKHGVLA